MAPYRNGRMAPGCQVTSFQALSAALQHPALTSAPQMVCSMLQCCKSWRAALQQCTAGNMQPLLFLSSASKLARFCAWLPKHGGLVAGVYLYACASGELDTHYDVAHQLVACGLQHAAATAALVAAGVTAAAPVAPLCLRSFGVDFIRGPELLLALPAATLTKLELHYLSNTWSVDINHGAIVRALSRLTGLRELNLTEFVGLGNACLAAVGQLTCLTKLALHRVAGGSDLQQLPPQLQELVMSCVGSTPVKLGHLAALQQLEIAFQHDLAGSVFPMAVTKLGLKGWSTDGSDSKADIDLTLLQQLVHLRLSNVVVQQLQQLSALEQLWRLDLEYRSIRQASNAAPAWKHLSQLQSLEIGSASPVNAERCLVLLEGLSAATSLKSLVLKSDFMSGNADGVGRCVYLKGLRKLRCLELCGVAVPNHIDMLHVTSLTKLTSLCLRDISAADDLVAVGIGCSLKQLLLLELRCCGVRTGIALPAIASLTSLECLCLVSGYDAEDKGQHVPAADLSILTALKRLRLLACSGAFEAAHSLWDGASYTWKPQQM